jgi:hypothetical protein
VLLDEIGGRLRLGGGGREVDGEVAREAGNDGEDRGEEDDPGQHDPAAAAVDEVAQAS